MTSKPHSDWIPYSVLDDEGSNLRQQKLDRQRALLEQKQKKKRQEPLMVQANADGRPRSRRARQSEEQAPLVESYLSGSTGYQVQEADSLASVPLGTAHPTAPASAKRTKAAAAAGGQGGASRKERKGKHKGWLAFTAPSSGGPAPTVGLAGCLSSRLGGEGLGESPRGEPQMALRIPQLAHWPPPAHVGPAGPWAWARLSRCRRM